MRYSFVLFLLNISLLSCNSSADNGESFTQISNVKSKVSKLGIQDEAKALDSVFTRIKLKDFHLPVIDEAHISALQNQKTLLAKRDLKKEKFGNLLISDTSLLSVINSLLAYQYTEPYELIDNLELYKIWGGDKKGHVQFTGYFTPIIYMNDTLDETYFYPIYNFPSKWEGLLPTREEIDGKFVLDGMGLELAYAKDPVDIYFMQVQGSGYVKYPDGRLQLMEYNGSNRHPYRSIGKYIVKKEHLDLKDISMDGIKEYLKINHDQVDSLLFQNPSYTFFKFSNKKPRGAGQVSLSKMISVAVDERYIPLGSCLLAKIPRVSKNGKVLDFEIKLLYAQDVGGAIKGTGHIDIYMGVGNNAKKQASNLYHYGELYLLLPKQK